jgi:hypothetical protein
MVRSAAPMKLGSRILVLIALLPRPALAALTDSEKAVVRTFIVKGVADTAPRVRALVGRPDLTPAEVSAALRPGIAEAPFDEKHQRFLDALLFGQGSAASRSALVPAVVEGLLAKASAAFADVPLEPGARVDSKGRKASEESLAIHAYVDHRIANAGTPPADGHDPAAGIRDDALEAAARLYKDYLAAHSQAFGTRGRVAPEMLRTRLQSSLALVDLGAGIVPRHTLSEWLGFGGERRAVFERTGVVVDADGAPDARVAAAVKMLESAGPAAEGLSAWLVSKASPAGVVARGTVARAGATLGEGMHPVDGTTVWPPEVKPSSPDAALVAVAFSAADLATGRVLSGAPALRERARTAAEHAARAGAPGYLAPSPAGMTLAGALGQPAPAPSPTLVLAGAVELLLLDGTRAIEVALIRAGEGRPEPLEQLALALTVLTGEGGRLTLGVAREGGGVDMAAASEVKLGGDGLVTSFAFGGRRFTVVADKDGVFSARVDGAIPKLTQLPDFRERTVAAKTFRANGVDYDLLFGEPKGAGLDDGRLVLEGSKAGFDAIVTGPVGTDQDVAAVIRPAGAGGGLIVRGREGDDSYEGVGVMLEVDYARVRLLRFDGHAKAAQLAEPIPLPAMQPKGYIVSLKAEGDQITAKVDGRVLTGKLRVVGEIEPGRVGLAIRADTRLDVMHLVAKTKVPEAPAGRPRK